MHYTDATQIRSLNCSEITITVAVNW